MTAASPTTHSHMTPILHCCEQLDGELPHLLTDDNPEDVSDGHGEEGQHAPDDHGSILVRTACERQQSNVDDINRDGDNVEYLRCPNSNNVILVNDWHSSFWGNLVAGGLTKCVLELLPDLLPVLDDHAK